MTRIRARRSGGLFPVLKAITVSAIWGECGVNRFQGVPGAANGGGFSRRAATGRVTNTFESVFPVADRVTRRCIALWLPRFWECHHTVCKSTTRTATSRTTVWRTLNTSPAVKTFVIAGEQGSMARSTAEEKPTITRSLKWMMSKQYANCTRRLLSVNWLSSMA